MKKFLTLILAIGCTMAAVAQQAEKAEEKKGYQFTDVKVLETTPVKNQNRSGTCWCYSTLSFLENEIIKEGGKAVHLSEMYVVRLSYLDKAERYVRMHGSLNFAEGGAAHDVTDVIKKHGIVPFEVYKGLNYGTDLPDFHELTAVMKAYLDAVIRAGESSRRALSTAWKRGFNAILDEYFGPLPETFTWEGKEYTPASYAASLPIEMDNYIDISSFTHHPFYETFVLEVPDNWMGGEVYNLPLEEMMRVVDHALEQGYSLAWGTDVSEKGFSRTKAIGVVPEMDPKSMSGTEAERWGAMTAREREAALYSFDKPGKEREITQELRQEAFDNWETTDDHGMVIMGTAVDQNGTAYYKVQNSWDTVKPYDGFWYFSKSFVAYKTTDLMVNKKALPKDIAKKLGL